MKVWDFRLALCASTAIAVAMPVQAQEAVGEAGNDIVVSARRKDERLQDVPISITVFNPDQLAERNVVNASDLATYTPSLSSNSNFGTENTTFAIRGFAQDIGTLPSVGAYFAEVVTPRGASNGVPTGDGVLPGSFFDLQNVQVLKGPQGTLFGRNTTGGAVLLVPQKPTSQLEGYLEGSYGNYDMKRVQGAINLPLSDTFRVRLAGDRMTRDGYLNNVGGIGPKDFSDVDYWAGRLSIVGDLTPNLENYTIFSYVHSDTNGPLTKLVAADPTEGMGGFAAAQLARQGSGFYDVINPLADSYSKIDQWQVINTTTWQASDTLTIKNIASYAEYKQTINAGQFGVDFLIDFAQVNPALAALGTYHVPFTQISPPPGLKTADQNTFTEELQLQGHTPDGRLEWQTGGYLEVSRPLGESGSQSPFLASCTDQGAQFQCVDPIGFLSNLNPAVPDVAKPLHVGSVNYTVGKTYFHDVGLYAQATYKLTEQLKVTGGIRYTWDRQRNISDRRTYVPNYPPVPGLFPMTVNPRCTDPAAVATGCVVELKQSSNKPTWLLGLDYNPTPDILVYAKYARGYRAATIAPNVAAPLNLVEPEKVDTYEAGVKASFHGAVRGTFNMAAFYNDFSNQQLQIGFNAAPGSGQSSTAAPVNVNKSKIYGLEAEASLTPFTGFDLSASYTYLHTEITSVPDFSNFHDPNFVLAAPFEEGDPEVLSPKHKLTASAKYTLPLAASIGDISFGAIFTYRSGMQINYTDRENPNPAIAAFSTLPSLSLLNLNMSWNSIAGSPVDLALFATNVTKEKYYTFAGSLGSPELGFETANVGEPRMYGLRLKYTFGR
ncbi:TonB-dependent receptor [Novosphingobium album (ex Liu et al. 2023)]|uniref:TonB-dependent receptor n=1 Tax=Novosphingobium album (ex Liu et al. 2023) TaxID=3031130 RepID=A0ABT5WXD1_9SPHN|nr:TonB-dependent receptor [Novosphingobium album (ex Liu et al. 2023)]MDE8654552.1 TonB-dependent receptor [Novosphingobium album (ex Liu et al. 2023)]